MILHNPQTDFYSVVVFHGDARPFRDIWIPATGIRAAGIRPAVEAIVGVSIAWEFADGAEKEIQFNFRIPSGFDPDADITVSFGWSSPAQSKLADWEFTYLITAVGDDVTAAGTMLQSLGASSSVANGMAVTTFTIPAAEISADSLCVHVNLVRDSDDATDTLGDVAHVHGMCAKVRVIGMWGTS